MESCLLLNENAVQSWRLFMDSLHLPPAPLIDHLPAHKLSSRKGTFKNPVVVEVIAVFECNPTLRRLSVQDIKRLAGKHLEEVGVDELERRINDLSRDTCGWLIKEVNYSYKRGEGSKYLYSRNLAYINEWKIEGERAAIIMERIQKARALAEVTANGQ